MMTQELEFQLMVEAGNDAGCTFVSPGALVTIGRRGDLALTDRRVSRVHCTVESHAGRWIVSDLDSANGTELDGVAIGVAWARPGSMLVVGDTRIRISGGEQVEPVVRELDEVSPPFDGTRPWREQRDRWMRHGERRFVEAALVAARNVSEAARSAGVNRASFYRMMCRAGLR
jgi:hypothetical protein